MPLQNHKSSRILFQPTFLSLVLDFHKIVKEDCKTKETKMVVQEKRRSPFTPLMIRQKSNEEDTSPKVSYLPPAQAATCKEDLTSKFSYMQKESNG